MSVNLNLSEIVTIRLRRDTSANWESINPILKIGEPGLETDTRKLKFGDGVTAWTSLSYTRPDSNDPLLLESVDDRVASLIKAGSNISLNYNDSANELTVSASGLQLAGDYATLISGRVPAAQLPSYVDDVIEANNFAALPVSGETGKIYVTLDSNKVYRWSGSVYIEISPSPGSTDSVIEGSTNLYYTNSRASAAAPVQSVAGKTGTVTLAKSDVGLGNVDNTSDANKPISSATQTALNSKAPLASPTFTGTVNGITKSMVGLGNVDNTSDANKPISSATQTALNGKALSVHTHSSNDISDATSFGKNILKAASYADINGLLWEIPAVSGSPPTFTAANGGHYYIPPSLLSFIKFNDPISAGDFYRVCSFDSDITLNIGNISYTNSGGIDIVRVYSTTSWETIRFNNHTHAINNISELQTALDSKQASGNYATLTDGKVPSSQLPSYVDDVIEVANLAALPVSGETSKIYVTLDSNKVYRWSGSTYVEISPSPGSTDSITEGSVNLYYTNSRASAAAPVQSVNGSTGIVTIDRLVKDDKTVILGSNGSVTLPSGSILSETNNTLSLMPPTAASGQSLVVRPTAAIWAISSSNYIEYGNPITIVVTLGSWAYFGTVNYTISGTGVTPQSLGRALTGKLTFVSTTGPDAESITWTIPANSDISEFTLTLTSVDGTRSIDQEIDNDPALYYDFEESNGMPIGQFITVTNNGISSSEHSHVHLVAGDPSIVDIYLGDDDQYVKIEKDGGNVVIGTDLNNNHWTFGTDGTLTLPQGGVIDETLSVDTLTLVNAGLVAVNQTYIKTSPTLYTGSNGVTIVALGDGVWFCIQDNDTKYSSTDNLTTWDNSTGGLPVPTSTVNSGVDTVNITVGTETWTFGQDGNLTFPDGSIQTTAPTVIDVVQGSGVSVTSSSGTFTVGVSGLNSSYISDFNSSVNDRVGDLLIAGDNIDLDYISNPASLTVSIDPTFLNTSLVAGNGISLDYADDQLTVNISGLDASYISDFTSAVSTATQTALNSKAPLASPTFTGTVNGITSSMVGLGNVDNTSDDNKPISSATQTALDGKASSVHTHTSSNISNFNESVNDRVGDLLVAGDNISLEYINSPASLTVSIVPTFLNTSLVAGSGISLSYANSELTMKVSGLNASYISDFSSSVSGLLPVKNVVQGSGINVTSSSGTFTVGVSGLNSSYISDFSSSVSGLLPVKNVVQGSGINVTSSDGIFTVSTSGIASFTQLYPTVVNLSVVSSTISTDASAGQIFNVALTSSATLSNPTNPIDGVTLRWRIQQDAYGSHTVTLDDKFQIPTSATSPLPFSTAPYTIDLLAATYNSANDNWDIIAFVMGY